MVLIYYFSGTGNTRYAANKLADLLMKSGVACTAAQSIEEMTPAEASRQISSCQAVLFGYPIYGSYTSELMVDFLHQVTVPARVKVGFFCTQLVFSGDGARIGHELLGSEARTCWGIPINMPNNLNCGSFWFLPITNEPRKIRRYLKKADRKIEILADRIQHHKEYRIGFTWIARLLGLLQRPGYIRIYKKSWHSAMQVDQGRCTHCGLCLAQCPSGNVCFENGRYAMHDTCTLCLRCYNFCPVQAVLFLGKSHRPDRDTYHGLPADVAANHWFFNSS